MMEDLKQSLIEAGVFKKDGSYNCRFILPPTIDLSNVPGDSLKEKICIIFKYNGVHPTCPVCGKPARFWSYSNGFRTTCSNECKKVLDARHCKDNNERRHSDLEYRKEIVDKYRQTSLSRYGTINPNQNPEIKNKAFNTCLERYGVKDPGGLPFVREKIVNTWLGKYGVDNPSKVPEIKKKILSHKGMTSPEKKVAEFLTNRGFDFEYEYEVNGKNFDFAIFKDNELSILIEIDGEYYHSLLSDPDGFNVDGNRDAIRFSKVPENVKLIIIDSLRIEEGFSEILRVFNIDYEEWIKEIINSLPQDFPFYSYSEERIKKDYQKLKEMEKYKKGARLADSTIKHFHKSIYYARVGDNLSPYETWYNKKLLEKCVRNRFIYSSSLSSHSILNGFNVCKIAPKVSVFSASLARYITSYFIDEPNMRYDTIFDPFSGFSGRMLGVCSLDKKYIGQDINQIHVDESNEIIKFHNLNAKVVCKDIFESRGEYECLFTCPPYNDKETWNDNDINLSCDEWIDVCLERFKCSKYVFVVDKTEKYKDDIYWEIPNSSHFSSAKEYLIMIYR